MQLCNVVCVTGVKNEDWIVEITLKENSKTFETQIYYDQYSEDKTVEIIARNKGAQLIVNHCTEFNERRRVLDLYDIAKASGAKIYFNLDADEFLFVLNPEVFWDELCCAPFDAAFEYEWINLHPDLKRHWSAGYKKFAATTEGGNRIIGNFHIDRIPVRSRTIKSQAAKVIHLQYLLPENIREKQAWYILHEFESRNIKSGIEVFRKYSHMWEFLIGHGLIDNKDMNLKLEWNLKKNQQSDWKHRLSSKRIATSQIDLPLFAQEYLKFVLGEPVAGKLSNIIVSKYIKWTVYRYNFATRVIEKILKRFGL